MGACIIGVISGILVVYSVFFFDKIGIDDCVGAISVHGTNGFFGILSVGLFANGEYGAGYNGVSHAVSGIMPIWGDPSLAWFSSNGWHQLLAQFAEGCGIMLLGFGIMYPWFKISNFIVPLRVSPEVELEGLDMPEMGALGYPDFELKTTPSISSVSEMTKV
jgi:ammonium transporter, Amt family